MRTIKSEADRITGIVQRLLDFARRRRPQRARTDLWSLAERTMVLLKSMADKRNIELRLRPRSESEQNEALSADVDEAQIQQVLTNLIVNAVQAAPEKSSVEIVVEHGTLDSHAGEPQSMNISERMESTPAIRVSVSDRGPGVPADLRDRIFEPFFTTKDVGEGTGLGLSIVYGIMEEHGGRIVVTDRDGGGAEFIALLPIRSLPTSSQDDRRQQQANEES
ncbi:MAG: HAMP domain-containing sensor histidine kinase [Pirellulales bacterium]